MLIPNTTVSRFARFVSLAAVATISFASPVAARESVDPSTLNPPPPDFFNATCEHRGQNIVCNLAFSDDPIVDEPSGILCDGTEILFSQNRSVVGKRFYDAASGDLLQRHFREDLNGTLSNPATGVTLNWIQQDTVIHNLAVPGDVLTGTTTVTGTAMRVFTTGGRTVLSDAGRVTIDAASDSIVRSDGPHRFDDYFVRGDATALDAVCDALG
jgi:hypothetical protein